MISRKQKTYNHGKGHGWQDKIHMVKGPLHPKRNKLTN
jgi:hypothetical protein